MAKNPQIEGAGAVVAEVDAGSNAKISLGGITAATVGNLLFAAKNDSQVLHRWPRTGEDNRLLVEVCNPRFDYSFTATAQDTGHWKHVFTTMTMTQSGGFLNCNANSTTTTATGCSLQSWQHFPLLGNGALELSLTCQFTTRPQYGQIFEWGAFLPTTTTAPTEGAFMQFTSAGLVGVVVYSGLRTETAPLWSFASLVPGQNYKFTISISQDVVEFWEEDTFLGQLITPAGNGRPYQQVSLPLSIQFRNASALTGAAIAQVKVADCSCDQADMMLGREYSHFAALNGMSASQGQSGGTMGSTAFYANNLAPGAGAALSNTATLVTGLGGQCAILPTDNATTLPISTDGIVCSYQVPAGGVNQTPRSLVITGVRLQGVVTTILAGGPVTYTYSLAYGHTAVSMATTQSASFANNTTKAPIRIPLGVENYILNAPLGTLGSTGLYVPFKNPIVVNPGEFVAICARNDNAITTTGVITVLVTFDAYWR